MRVKRTLQGKIRQGEKTESKARERSRAITRARRDGQTEIRRARRRRRRPRTHAENRRFRARIYREREEAVSKTKKRLEEEQRFKEEAERKKKEFESQRDELRDTLRNEREKFEKDGKLLKFACEDATKELEIVKQSYREEKQHDEQVIQSLRDALDAVVAENEEKKKVGESTFSPPATPKSKPPATPKIAFSHFAIVSDGKRPVGVGSGDTERVGKSSERES